MLELSLTTSRRGGSRRTLAGSGAVRRGDVPDTRRRAACYPRCALPTMVRRITPISSTSSRWPDDGRGPEVPPGL